MKIGKVVTVQLQLTLDSTATEGFEIARFPSPATYRAVLSCWSTNNKGVFADIEQNGRLILRGSAGGNVYITGSYVASS